MQLRKGKTKTILENSIDCALIAVETFINFLQEVKQEIEKL